jgi:hypothetical protein
MLCHVALPRSDHAQYDVRLTGRVDTVADLLYSEVESPCIVACPLCVTSKSTSYYRRPMVSISYTHLMLTIHRVCLVLYVFNMLTSLRA